MKGMTMKKILLAVSVAMSAALMAAVKVEFKVETDHADCLYRCGEKAVFTVTVADPSGKALKAGCFKAKLDNFGSRVLAEKEVDLAKGNPFTIAAVKDTPGFMRLSLSADANAFTLPKTPGQGVFSWGVAYEPEKICPGAENPSDFDSFWADAVKKLDETIPPDVRLEKIDAKSTPRHTCSRISFATYDGRRVWGWLNMPAGDGPFPVRVNVPGAGIGALGTEVSDAMITLTMNVHSYPQPDTDAERQAAYKAQDEKYAAPRGVLRYCQAGIHISREAYFYYASLLGINRAVNWLWKQPQVDRRRFTYSGTSQGGGFGFMLTALNGHFTKSCIFVPAITDLLGSRQEERQSGWPRIIEAQKPENRTAAEKNAPYFDGVNFAARITCPVRVVVGFADCICAPAGVYAAYNLIPSRDKKIIHGIGMGHSVYGRFYRQLRDWELSLDTNDGMRLGCQMWGVKEFWEKDPEKGFAEVFPKLRAMGYEGVQSMAFWKINPDRLEAMLKANGLALADMPVNFEQVEGTNVEGTVAFCRRFGIDFVYIPWFKGKTADEWRAFCDRLIAAGKRLAPYGIRIGYHNHVHEFTEPLQGEYPADILKGNREVNLELDIGPVTESGNDASAWIAALSGRVPGMHAKPHGATAAGAPGDVQDWPKIVAAARKAGVKWFVVECEKRKDTYDDVSASAAHLKSVGSW